MAQQTLPHFQLHFQLHFPLASLFPLVPLRNPLFLPCFPPPHPHRPRRLPYPPPKTHLPFLFVSRFCHVEKLPFSAALTMVSHLTTTEKEGSKCVAYLQEQNDCFRNEYCALSQDCDDHISWASEALGCLPEAVNLWIGNHLSVTSFHKDHYENLYAVITGEKHFLLLPPTDVHRMYIREYPAAQYHYSKDSGEFSLELEDPGRHVPWCSVNPYSSPKEKERQMAQFPLYYNGPKPFEVTIKAGQVLYLNILHTDMGFIMGHHGTQATMLGGYLFESEYCGATFCGGQHVRKIWQL